jgi:hypothetical protein
MEKFWRDHSNWGHIGADHRSDRHPPDPKLPKPPKVRVRALGRSDGSARFRLNGECVAPGRVVSVDADDVLMLIATGKAELTHD